MSKDNSSKKDHFDKMSVDIGAGLLKVQMMITEFVIDLLLQSESLSYDLDLSVPHQFSEEFVNVKIAGIAYDSELNVILIESEKSIRWEELNIISQDLIATHMHIEYSSQHFLTELS